jgi:hypothetical protein
MTDIRHIPGTENIVADVLSLPSLAAFRRQPKNLEYARIAANQRTCQETLKAASSTSLQLHQVDMQGQQVTCGCDISTGQPRPLIPLPDRMDVFRALYEPAHELPIFE